MPIIISSRPRPLRPIGPDLEPQDDPQQQGGNREQEQADLPDGEPAEHRERHAADGERRVARKADPRRRRTDDPHRAQAAHHQLAGNGDRQPER
jgi:hypothetical protein